jgi:glycosyltransferase involved in cell wall biosynthesis
MNGCLSDKSRVAKLVVIIPAFYEEASIGRLLDELLQEMPNVHAVVINDGSKDSTVSIASSRGATVLNLPCNLGVGGAVQAGFQYAINHGCDYVVRIDADGQHPPGEIKKLIAEMERSGTDLIIGTRFGATCELISTRLRYSGIRVLALFMSVICRNRVTDPTSGFWMLSRPLLDYFANYYPSEYPEPEALALLCRQGYSFREVPVHFRARKYGQSSITSWGTLYYAIKVGLALVVDRLRVINHRFAKPHRRYIANDS